MFSCQSPDRLCKDFLFFPFLGKLSKWEGNSDGHYSLARIHIPKMAIFFPQEDKYQQEEYSKYNLKFSFKQLVNCSQRVKISMGVFKKNKQSMSVSDTIKHSATTCPDDRTLENLNLLQTPGRYGLKCLRHFENLKLVVDLLAAAE